MDTKFQTSFIPKKPLIVGEKVNLKRSSMSVFMFVAIIIFILSVAGAIFSVLWKSVLLTSQEGYRVELKKAEDRFNSALIDELRKANLKIDLTKKLLDKHLAVSEIFSIVSALTIDGVRFESFDFGSPGKENNEVRITMKGVGKSFSSIAFQSDVFGQSEKYGTNKVLKNPLLSDLVLDKDGNVGFTFSTTINPDDISYEKALLGETNINTQ